MAFTKLKQIPSRICDFRLLLLASRKPSSEHPKSQILVVGSIVFEHLLDLSGSTGKARLAWICSTLGSTPAPRLAQSCPKPTPKATFQKRNSSQDCFVKLCVLCAKTISKRISTPKRTSSKRCCGGVSRSVLNPPQHPKECC